MSEMASKHLISGRSMKLVAGGLSLAVLAVLAVLTAGYLADDSETESATPVAAGPTRPAGAGTGGQPGLPSGGPALHSAIANGDVEMVRILIDGSADVNARDTFGDPPLHAAIYKGHVDIVSLLLARGANVDAKNTFGDPALHRAILDGDREIVRILVDAGADVNITNAFGDSALELAVSQGDQEILQILLDASGG